jgi:hypothetical protein
MKFKDKVELFKMLKKEVKFIPSTKIPATPVTVFKNIEPQMYPETSAPINTNPSTVHVVKDAPNPLEVDIEKIRQEAPSPEETKKMLEQDAQRFKSNGQDVNFYKEKVWPKIVESVKQNQPIGIKDYSMAPSPSETKILVDGELADNVYSIEYAYIYNVDDRTLLDKILCVREDDCHVIGCLTIEYFSTGDAATFDAKEITLVNMNDAGQMFEMHIIGVHTLSEVSGVCLDDIIMTKTIWFEAKDIVGRCLV